MNLDLGVMERATSRWQQREEVRSSNERSLRVGGVAAVEPEERIRKRMARLAEAGSELDDLTAAGNAGPAAVLPSPAPRLPPEPGPPAVPGRGDRLGRERTLGKRDFLGVDMLELALAVSRYVGRISIRTDSGRHAGYGTGFMVSPHLLMTNNHVLESASRAGRSWVEFDYQRNRFGRMLPIEVFRLQPERFFLTDADLDFTLVAVSPTSDGGTGLERYGWNRLIPQEGKVLIGEYLNIIQHPQGRMKEFVMRSNELVDLLDDFAHYRTDTEPGSSGSPVFNDQWEVVALHHSGVPRVENGNYIAFDGSIWQPGMDLADLDWIANEGVRVSSLVRFISEAPLADADQQRMREDLLTLRPPHPLEAAAAAEGSSPSVVVPETAVDRDEGRRPAQGKAPSGAVTLTLPTSSLTARAEGGGGKVRFTLPLDIEVEIDEET